MKKNYATVVIENLSPSVNCGQHAIKRVVGESLVVAADIFKDGHDKVAAVLKWRIAGQEDWHETPMEHLVNDRWQGACTLYENAEYEYTIEAWADQFAGWVEEFDKKYSAGQQQLDSEILEGAALVAAAAERAESAADRKHLKEIATRMQNSPASEVHEISRWSELTGLLRAWPDRSLATEFTPYHRVWVDRSRAAFAAWYEFFPRSAEGKPDRGSTFRDCLERIDDARAMGFDVIYFPPVHPIGETKRKGRNNSVTCEPGDPGVPYAIGNRHQDCPNGGGHMDVAPELGTLDDFDWLVGEINQRGMEVALDFAINCSPDHPYVEDHPDWFYKRPDGTIKYAENPPKKYEDVYPLNFHSDDWRALWGEMIEIILFWARHKVRIFRVDNPHTKPVVFWEQLIARVRAEFPDVIFLSEAFTRPKMMQALAKIGFAQSYTYFTWRNTKHELTEYLTELSQSEMVEYFRPNFFTNTPDILPFFLQHGGRPAFQIRAILAATLTPLYGIYSGFELCENDPVPGKEEYWDSEKYQFKGRDWGAPGNIKPLITLLNQVRNENRALHRLRNLQFHQAENEQVLCYSKLTAARDNMLLMTVSLDPFHRQDSYIHVPLDHFGLKPGETYQVHDLLSGNRYLWQGSRNYIELDPHSCPAHIFRLRRWVSREQNFDYFL